VNGKVLVYPAGGDTDAVSQYRLLHPAAILQAQGKPIRVTREGPTVLWSLPWTGTEPPPFVRPVAIVPFRAQTVVLQRPARRWWSDIIPLIQKLGIRVVVDVDDRFDALDKGHVAASVYGGGREQIVSPIWVDEACRLADLVTCSTEALAEHYGHGHGVVLPNCIPATALGIEGDHGAHRLGWSGTVETHPQDLPTVGSAVRRILEKSDWSVHIVGTGKGVKKAWRLRSEPTATGWVPFARYMEEMARLTIGLVPLAKTPFNTAKSRLKALEFAALGIPCVMSPTPDNVALSELGAGLLASTPEEWERHLTNLVNTEGMRSELGDKARAVAATQTYEEHAERWWSVWDA